MMATILGEQLGGLALSPRIDRLELVQLPVESLDRAREFYSGLFGAAPTADTEDAEGAAAVFDLGASGASLHLQRRPAPAQRPDGVVVALHVVPGSDIEELLATIESGGGVITYRESRNPDLLIVGFDDTEGNHLELLVTR